MLNLQFNPAVDSQTVSTTASDNYVKNEAERSQDVSDLTDEFASHLLVMS